MKESLKEYIYRVEVEVSGIVEYLNYILLLRIFNNYFMIKKKDFYDVLNFKLGKIFLNVEM